MLSFRKATKDLGLTDFVHFVGWEKNPWKSISGDAIVIIPSFYEGMPLVATEAMLHGVRIVTSPIPAFKEGIPNELIACDFSMRAFVEKVEEVSAMSHERLLALYAPSLRKFTEEVFVKKFLSILNASPKEAAGGSERSTSEEEN
jgi:glycosyltransferase involved in cell wall biosynthesis